MAETPEEVQPYVMGKWAGLDNYECNVEEKGLNCAFSTLDWEQMRQHLTGHGVYLLSKPSERPRFVIGAPVADREADETKAPPPGVIPPGAQPSAIGLAPVPVPAPAPEPAPTPASEPATRRRRTV